MTTGLESVPPETPGTAAASSPGTATANATAPATAAGPGTATAPRTAASGTAASGTAAENAADPGNWRRRPASQQPGWADPAQVSEITGQLAALPPLVIAAECDALPERLAAVTRGEAFVLQGGDCAETFAGAAADAVRGKLQTL